LVATVRQAVWDIRLGVLIAASRIDRPVRAQPFSQLGRTPSNPHVFFFLFFHLLFFFLTHQMNAVVWLHGSHSEFVTVGHGASLFFWNINEDQVMHTSPPSLFFRASHRTCHRLFCPMKDVAILQGRAAAVPPELRRGHFSSACMQSATTYNPDRQPNEPASF
jgi:hypothetical protein